MPSKLEFLYSTRFWTLLITSASAILIDPNFPTQEWYVSLGKFLALVGTGFIGIRTIDRFGEKSGAVDTGAVIASPTPSKVDVPELQGVEDPK